MHEIGSKSDINTHHQIIALNDSRNVCEIGQGLELHIHELPFKQHASKKGLIAVFSVLITLPYPSRHNFLILQLCWLDRKRALLSWKSPATHSTSTTRSLEVVSNLEGTLCLEARLVL
jgi:hypothetical protein